MHPLVIVALGATVWLGYKWWKKRQGEVVIVIDDEEVPDKKDDEPEDRTDEPKPKPKGTSKEPCERDGTCQVFARVGDEQAMSVRFARDVAKTDGANLAEKMPDHSLASDGIRKLRGGAPVNRRWRDQNPDQSDLSWMTNLTYWMVYPLGPGRLAKPNSGYARAWLRIRRSIRGVLDNEGVPYTV